MIFISGLLVGCVLSVFALGLLCILFVLHRPVAPTKYRRANRDKPIPEAQPPWEREESDRLFSCIDCGSLKPMDALSWGLCEICRDKAVRDSQIRHAQDERGVNYSFMGTTGLEE